jgi:hypothetical protein
MLLIPFNVVYAQRVGAEIPLPDLPFASAFHAAVASEVDALTARADFYVYCPEVDSYLSYSYGIHRLIDGKDSVFPGATMRPAGLTELFDADGKDFIARCERKVIAEAGYHGDPFKVTDQIYESLKIVVRKHAKAQIGVAISIVAASLAKDRPACVPAPDGVGTDCLGLRSDLRGAPTSLPDAIQTEDELAKAKMLIYATAVLAIEAQQRALVSLPANPSRPELMLQSEALEHPRRNIEQIEAITRRRQVASAAKFAEDVAKWAVEKAKADKIAAKQQEEAAAKEAELCRRHPCRCTNDCPHAF